MPILKLPISEQDLAELEGEGDFPFFISLAINGQQKVFHVNLRYRKFYDLIYAASGIKGSRHDRLHSPLIDGARLEAE